MSNIIYNKTSQNDKDKIDRIICFFENYKSHLNKKEFKIYQNYIPKITEIVENLDKIIKENMEEFKKNDSDNEEAYSNEYKNCENVDSISEYDTDTDDEQTKKMRKKLVIKTASIRNYNEYVRSSLPIKFKKI